MGNFRGRYGRMIWRAMYNRCVAATTGEILGHATYGRAYRKKAHELKGSALADFKSRQRRQISQRDSCEKSNPGLRDACTKAVESAMDHDLSFLLTYQPKAGPLDWSGLREKGLSYEFMESVLPRAEAIAYGGRRIEILPELSERLGLGIPDNENKGERYVLEEGCQPHNCGAHGFYWADLQEKILVVAIADQSIPSAGISCGQDNLFYIVTSQSRALLPRKALEAIRAWVKEDDLCPENARILAEGGHDWELAGQLGAKPQPSLDAQNHKLLTADPCTAIKGTLEGAFCRSPELRICA